MTDDVAALVEQAAPIILKLYQSPGYIGTAENTEAWITAAAAALTRLSEANEFVQRHCALAEDRAEKAEAALAEARAHHEHFVAENEINKGRVAERDRRIAELEEDAEKAEAALAVAEMNASHADLARMERDKRIAELEAEVTRLREALRLALSGDEHTDYLMRLEPGEKP